MVTNEILKSLLRQHPELHRKLQNFCNDYELHAKPSLIWQCHPIDESEVDVSARLIRDALEEGVLPSGQNGWWYSFNSGRRPVTVFDGIAAHSASDEPGWVTEFHSDGHVIAGLWTFPKVHNNGVCNLNELPVGSPMRILLEKLRKLSASQNVALVDFCERVWRDQGQEPLLLQTLERMNFTLAC